VACSGVLTEGGSAVTLASSWSCRGDERGEGGSKSGNGSGLAGLTVCGCTVCSRHLHLAHVPEERCQEEPHAQTGHHLRHREHAQEYQQEGSAQVPRGPTSPCPGQQRQRGGAGKRQHHLHHHQVPIQRALLEEGACSLTAL
jgi:hypothetical protein